MQQHRSRAGFTLLEISIVLLIIGFIIGGIMTGKGLIRSSELASVTSDIQRYRSAFASFELKYHFPPGDLPTAYDYWPNAGCTNALANLGMPGCNGNGDGFIDPTAEGFRAWQQLALSGIIPGRFTGAAPLSGVLLLNEHVPGTRIEGVGLKVDRDATLRINTFFIGRIEGFYTGFLTPAEAFQIDSKADDGKPLSGAIRIGNASAADSASYCMVSAEQYSLQNTFTGTSTPCRFAALIKAED
jgi:prepilin-type N-terminal cleavage/methylation domain-containing protein